MPLVNLPDAPELAIHNDTEGKAAPNVTVQTWNGGLQHVETGEFFKGKKVALFSLPGAFTPTCSASHAPGYDALAPLLTKAGIDAIVCVSVNDAFVMGAWEKDLGTENVIYWADGNTHFTAGMGALLNKEAPGFGPRSWRYSAIINDGTVEKVFAESAEPGDPFSVSDARSMLKHLDESLLPPQVAMISKAGCPHCAKAKATLNEMMWPYEEVAATTASLGALAGDAKAQTPQIFIDGARIGGNDELNAWLKNR